MSAVLVIEDEHTLAANIAAYLARHGHEVRTAGSAEEGLGLLEQVKPDLVLLDHNLPGRSGLDALAALRSGDATLPVIMMTGYGSTELAVAAMKAGAADFITKPVALGELQLLLERHARAERLGGTVAYFQQRAAARSGLDKIIGDSAPMVALRATLERLLQQESRLVDGVLPAVLIVGETGTGKELVARALHFDGPRQDAPFVELNCGALPAPLIEAELFGYERGAFTDARQRKAGLVETAGNGTVFLDEIGDAEAGTQVKLLKLLEDRRVRRLGGVRELTVHARIVSATNRPLAELVRVGQFRADLYWRLRIVEIEVPPLRARPGDALLLARHFLELHGARYRKSGLVLAAEAERAIERHAWPGNVRELRNAIEQAVLVSDERVISASALRLAPLAAAQAPEDLDLERAERRLIKAALERSGDNVSAAARSLGISRDTLRYRLERLGLRAPDELSSEP